MISLNKLALNSSDAAYKGRAVLSEAASENAGQNDLEDKLCLNMSPTRRVVRIPLLRWTNGLVNRIVMTGDVLLIIASSMLPFMVNITTERPFSIVQALLIAPIEAVIFVLVLQRLSAYRTERYLNFWWSVGAAGLGFLIAWSVGFVYTSAFQPVSFGVTAGFIGWHLSQVLLLVAGRQLARLLWKIARTRKLVRRNVVVIGANADGEQILRRLQLPEHLADYNVVGIFADINDEQQDGILLGIPVTNDLNILGVYAQTNVIDLVIVALPMSRATQRVEMIEHLQWMATDVVIPIGEVGIRPNYENVATIAGMSTLQVLHRPLKGSQAVLKIIEDYTISSLGLLMIWPLMLLVALAIRIDSHGPIFFLQERTGFNNRSFYIYKFRTMLMDQTDDGSIGTSDRNDPRITRVGRILRRLSLDELPQLLNVLRGDMSIVGPRPYVSNMLVGKETFRLSVPNYAFRYRLKPGITGLAQASGLRSNALRSMENARRSIELDLHYTTHWSIWLDVRIMVKTLFVAMAGRDVF